MDYGQNAVKASGTGWCPRDRPVDNHRASRDAGAMDTEDRYRDAMQAYADRFGHYPSTQWLDDDCNGDETAFIAMVRLAVKNSAPLPEWEESHGIPRGAKS